MRADSLRGRAMKLRKASVSALHIPPKPILRPLARRSRTPLEVDAHASRALAGRSPLVHGAPDVRTLRCCGGTLLCLGGEGYVEGELFHFEGWKRFDVPNEERLWTGSGIGVFVDVSKSVEDAPVKRAPSMTFARTAAAPRRRATSGLGRARTP